MASRLLLPNPRVPMFVPALTPPEHMMSATLSYCGRHTSSVKRDWSEKTNA